MYEFRTGGSFLANRPPLKLKIQFLVVLCSRHPVVPGLKNWRHLLRGAAAIIDPDDDDAKTTFAKFFVIFGVVVVCGISDFGSVHSGRVSGEVVIFFVGRRWIRIELAKMVNWRILVSHVTINLVWCISKVKTGLALALSFQISLRTAALICLIKVLYI